jgi:hypothetical protein
MAKSGQLRGMLSPRQALAIAAALVQWPGKLDPPSGPPEGHVP